MDPRSCPTSRLRWIRAATSRHTFLNKRAQVRMVKRHDRAFLHLVPHDWAANGRWIVTKEGETCVGPASAPVSRFASLQRRRLLKPSRGSRLTANGLPTPRMRADEREVYVCPFSGAPAEPSGKLQVSNNGGDNAVWGPLSREIFYVSSDGSAFAVSTRDLGRTETLPPPVRLFRTCSSAETLLGRAFDTRDGQRFLIGCRMEPPGRFTVLTNWTVP